MDTEKARIDEQRKDMTLSDDVPEAAVRAPVRRADTPYVIRSIALPMPNLQPRSAMTESVDKFQDHIRSIAGDQPKLEAFFTRVKTADDLVIYAADAGCPLEKGEAEALFEKGQAAYSQMQSQLSDDDLDMVVGGISFAAIGAGIGAAIGIAAITVLTAGVGTAAMATAVAYGVTTWGGAIAGVATSAVATAASGAVVCGGAGFVVDKVVDAVRA
ncbi:hypothetical protein DA075_18950 [Methylobacterium currus]|uniref:Uncharacterized protein n=1 Tax=Methylobacterium currus TaxID=2051553 RepID=A0A2R4WMF4_9HYPH|nr:hypothetical protein [Methylobacterium currus]AWB22723.1 hypothetical protein DA075_18950 [Methylobacterium currus]UHC17681.1 hypothetical protein LRS73_07340 [Methylobacterium currus]